MEFWFSELHSPHVKFDIRVEKQLFSGESDYQRIDVFQSPEFGKFLTLNGSVIFSEQDCFIYNEMVAIGKELWQLNNALMIETNWVWYSGIKEPSSPLIM